MRFATPGSLGRGGEQDRSAPPPAAHRRTPRRGAPPRPPERPDRPRVRRLPASLPVRRPDRRPAADRDLRGAAARPPRRRPGPRRGDAQRRRALGGRRRDAQVGDPSRRLARVGPGQGPGQPSSRGRRCSNHDSFFSVRRRSTRPTRSNACGPSITRPRSASSATTQRCWRRPWNAWPTSPLQLAKIVGRIEQPARVRRQRLNVLGPRQPVSILGTCRRGPPLDRRDRLPARPPDLGRSLATACSSASTSTRSGPRSGRDVRRGGDRGGGAHRRRPAEYPSVRRRATGLHRGRFDPKPAHVRRPPLADHRHLEQLRLLPGRERDVAEDPPQPDQRRAHERQGTWIEGRFAPAEAAIRRACCS